MKTLLPRAVVCWILLFTIRAFGAVHYVSLDSTNPEPPYLTWDTAATNIQDAIDASTNGDTVLVTNGIYNVGGTTIGGGEFVAVNTRVAITNAITVQSVNGPWTTIIEGASGPGNNGVRCAWLTNYATLSGFTLESGDQVAAAVYCAASSNCFVENCIITSNTSVSSAGTIYQGTVNNCLITGNGGTVGYVVYNAILHNCTIISNGLMAVNSQCLMTNCIDYYNDTAQVTGNGTPHAAAYCCSTPLLLGFGNFTNAPDLFVDGVHLSYGSPCIGAGTNVATGTDIFSQPWANPPSIGCAEYSPVPITIAPTISLTNNPTGFTIGTDVSGSPPLSVYWLKDGVPLQDGGTFEGTQTTNLSATAVSLAQAGNYQFVASNAFGVTASAVTTLSVHCVNASGTNPQPPYVMWATAATNIQDAINAAESGDIVLVTNGTYAYGEASEDGTSKNRIALNKAIRVQSVSGPFVTTIVGSGETNGSSAVRCAWLTNNAMLAGFTLAEGATASSGSPAVQEAGGGVRCATSSNCFVDNCVIVSNVAAQFGAGAYQGILRTCLLSGNGNTNDFARGAAYGGVLYNCTVVGNNGTGVQEVMMTNCLVYYNSARGSVENETDSVGAFCCITPALSGTGNFTNAPDLASDSVHLNFGSPCIGAGTNVAVGTDVFGQPWANPPSVGCAEFYPSAPVVGQPQIILGPNGFQITLTVAGQVPLTYQWFENGMPVQGGNFSGTQSSNLVVTGVNLAETGNYEVVVSNAAGATTSAVVQLNIHAVDLTSTNPQPPYLTWATAATNIQDAIEASAPGDIVLVTNGIYDSGGEAVAGLTNRVTLDRAILVTSVNGFKSTVIEGAWDPISTNGPAAVRCAWLTNDAILAGFTLDNGATLTNYLSQNSGAGVWCASTNALVSNCLLTNDYAYYTGGGMAYGTLDNSLIVSCVAGVGGGALDANLNNCTVVNNYATLNQGGGTFGGVVRNCIVVGNFGGSPNAITGLNNYGTAGSPKYYYCCSGDQFGNSPSGAGNFDADPLFLDWYHISIFSPCRDAGSALYSSGTDLDGEPWNNPPSVGCDEVVPADRTGSLALTIQPFQTNVLVSSSSIQHLDSFFGQVDGLASYLSWSFGDGTVMTNAADSVLHFWTNVGFYTVELTAYNVSNPLGVSASIGIYVVPVASPQLQPPTIVSNNIIFDFPMQEGGNYIVQYTTNLTPPVTWTTLQSVFDSLGGTQQVQDSPTNAERFYRVGAQ